MQDYVNIYRDLYNALCQAPSYHLFVELGLVLFVIYIMYARSWRPRDREELSQKEKDQLVAEWEPEPLVPRDFKMPETIRRAFSRQAVTSLGKYVKITEDDENEDAEPLNCLNVASFNYLNFVGDSGVEDAAVKALRHYGVGSCGPRGFYGTMDVHLRLEKDVAEFMKGEEAVLYSYGFSTVASAIPAYAKRNDIIYADEAVSFAIRQGLVASRSRVHYFKHNDYGHLDKLLQDAAKEDARDPNRARVTRKFMVLEGLYLNRGTICPLPEFVKLKYKYKVRLFVDESHSFGVLGKTGRGITEHWGVDIKDVEMITASLENAIGSGGGFSVGTKFVVDHQRLSGQGYTFSASLPPLLAAAACHVLEVLDKEDGKRTGRLASLSKLMHKQLQQKIGDDWTVSGDEESPVKHVRLRCLEDSENTTEMYDCVMDKARERGLLLTVARYLPVETNAPPPSIRLALNCDLSDDECDTICRILGEVGKEVKKLEESQI